jgi:hypothetical protein
MDMDMDMDIGDRGQDTRYRGKQAKGGLGRWLLYFSDLVY